MVKPVLSYLVIISLFIVVSCSRGTEVATIEQVQEPAAAVPEKVFAEVIADSLRVRVSPYLDAEIIGHLMTGNRVIVESRSEWTQVIAGEDSSWFFVRADGYSGWTYGGFLDFGEISPDSVASDPGLLPPSDGDGADGTGNASAGADPGLTVLNPQIFPEILLPVFGLEDELQAGNLTEGVISYDPFHENLIIPFSESSDSEIRTFSVGNDDTHLHIVAEASGSTRYERSYTSGDYRLLSESSLSHSLDALLIPFYRLASLPEGSWEIYAFLDDNNWPVAVGKIDISPAEISFVTNPDPNPLRDSPRSHYLRNDTVHAFGISSSGSGMLQVVLYHESDEYREGKILLQPVVAVQLKTDSSGFWSADFQLDEKMPAGRYWGAVGNPVAGLENLRLFITSITL